ncbi:MAG: class II aldolase/adducin family protein [Candidatus Freyarchaeota archaeon]|nr:class II aldolase/adducin family protein [Candidatus Freyrarchaeum guaymaensis]RLG96445.1 MAG: fuculose phosphate aldolase [Candidatus Bathyarchaeota archaeon]
MPRVPSYVYEELKDYCSRMARRGYVTAHGGNASIRSGDIMWITRHASSLEELRVDDVIQVYVDKPSGFEALASTETIVHREVYRRTPNLAVLHAHPPYSVALSLFLDELVPPDAEGYYVLKSVPVVSGKPGSEELAVNVSEALRRSHAVIVRNHGVFTAAKFMDVAYQYMCMVEHSAEIAYLALTLKAAGLEEKPQNL